MNNDIDFTKFSFIAENGGRVFVWTPTDATKEDLKKVKLYLKFLKLYFESLKPSYEAQDKKGEHE